MLKFQIRSQRTQAAQARPLLVACLAILAALTTTKAADIVRAARTAGSNTSTATAAVAANPVTSNAAGVPEVARQNAEARLTAARDAVAAVRAMQVSANAAAQSLLAAQKQGASDLWYLGRDARNQDIYVSSGLSANGLLPDSGVQKNSDGSYAVPNSWSGIGSLTQASTTDDPTKNGGSTNSYTVTLNQNQQQAVLNWANFNVAPNTEIYFNQTLGGADVGNWIAFNKIGNTGSPSQILGRIRTEGQVYVINPNGIIFGGTSQVNTHTLVASSLPINDNLVTNGLLSQPGQFQFSGLADGVYGDVKVEAGATLFSPTTSDHQGGRVALIGPNVTNAGTISAPDGQVILAAGLQVGFSASNDASLRGLDTYVGQVGTGGTATNAANGLIETADLTQVDSYGAPVVLPGAVTVVGKEIDQLGIINSSTTVSFNGRIDLKANYNAHTNTAYDSTTTGSTPFLFSGSTDATGIVRLGPNSLTQIMPSDSLSDRIAGTIESGLVLRSQINLQGQTIYLLSDNGQSATVRAPNAIVNLLAGSWMENGPINNFYYAGGQIFMDSGTSIDVAGTQGASASVTENIVAVELRSSELANSPLQRDGALRGQTVLVDLRVHGPWDPSTGTYSWVGTPLADTSGWVSLVQRTAGELTIDGGTVNFNSGGPVIMQQGAKVDVSGGWIDYQAGRIQTTKVISGGHIFDISQATPDRVYDGIFTGSTDHTNTKWGIAETISNQTLLGYDDPGYVQGGNGGRVAITAPWVALDGDFSGQTWSGARQILTTPTAGANSFVSKPSEFSLKFSAQFLNTSASGTVLDYSPTPTNVVIEDGALLAKNATVVFDTTGAYTGSVNDARRNEVDVSPDLVNKEGFGFVSITNSDDNLGSSGRAGSFGSITLPTDTVLNFSPASALWSQLSTTSTPYYSLQLTGANLDLAGDVYAPGGNLYFAAKNVSDSLSDRIDGDMVNGVTYHSATTPYTNRGKLAVESSASFGVAGEVIDYRVASTDAQAPVAINGGTVSMTGLDLTVADGSSIDVSGGANVSSAGKVTWGSGGKISLAVQGGLRFDGGSLTLPDSYLGLNPDAVALRGFSGGTGAELDITAPLIQVGGVTEPGGKLHLDPIFFSSGGFSKFVITGLAQSSQPDLLGLLIGSASYLTAPSTSSFAIAPQVLSYRADLSSTGTGILQTYLPDLVDRAPVSLSFAAGGNQVIDLTNAGKAHLTDDLFVGADASIFLPANATSRVSLKGGTVAVQGSVTVPGGNITVSGTNDPGALLGDTMRGSSTVYLGSKSNLTTAGAAVTTTDTQGYVKGSVLNGGSISVSGNIVAEAGALLDVSGTSGILDVSPYRTSIEGVFDTSSVGSALVRTTVESDGGSIALTGKQSLFSDATLSAHSGGLSALGGTLTVASGLALPPSITSQSPVLPTLVVTTDGVVIPSSFASAGKTAIGNFVRDGKGNVISSVSDAGLDYFGGTISTASIVAGGFDWLNLNGNVKISGVVNLKAGSGIALGSGGVLLADSNRTSSLSLNAPYVALGGSFIAPLATGDSSNPYGSTFAPTYGNAALSVSGAKLIEIGNLSLQNIGMANLTTVPGGDVRGDGTFDLAGTLTITAGQVYPPSAVTFNVVAYDHTLADGTVMPGSVTFNEIGTPAQVPLSAGGTLNVYASTIVQNGVIRAPLGKINLGADMVSGITTTDSITGAAVPTTSSLTLSSSSVTSVSTIDLALGASLSTPIPYGNNLNGTSWIDPTGADITVTDSADRTAKKITLSASSINDQSGSTVDLAGGGDLYAYRFVSGVNGTKDILKTDTSFAILPSYDSAYAPYATFHPSSSTDNLGGDGGYVSSKLKVGDRIYLDLNDGKGPKIYTLLPAKYALLTGAYLVTPKSTVPSGTVTLADGSSLVAGYKFNSLNSARPLQPLYTGWEVAPSSVVRSRAEYDDSSGNNFFTTSAAANNVAVRLLPEDAGQLVLAAQKSMILKGSVNAQPERDVNGNALGHGGLVDITSPQDILVAGSAAAASSNGNMLVLTSADLSNFGADSLLIGGVRSKTILGTTVAVMSDNLTVDNAAGASLNGPDVVLVANKNLKVSDGSLIQQKGTMSGLAETLIVGKNIALNAGSSMTVARAGSALIFPNGTPTNNGLTAGADAVVTSPDGKNATAYAAGSVITVPVGGTLTLAAAGTLMVSSGSDSVTLMKGDGTLIRVSSDLAARTSRAGISFTSNPTLTIGAGATLTGANVILDSTDGTSFAPSATLSGDAVTLDSGRISLLLQPASGLQAAGLVLPKSVIDTLQTRINSLSLLSYSSIDLFGSGTIGSANLDQLELHAEGIRGYNVDTSKASSVSDGGGAVSLVAKAITIDNSTGALMPTSAPTASGTTAADGASTGSLTVQADTVRLGTTGTNAFNVAGFSRVSLEGAKSVTASGNGGLSVQGNLTITTPVITATTGANQAITSTGILTLTRDGLPNADITEGNLGASLTLTGTSVAVDTDVSVRSGILTVQATSGDVQIGKTASSLLDVSGVKKSYFDTDEYTNGGAVNFRADGGSVIIGANGMIDVAAQPGGGDAGSLSILAPKGILSVAGRLLGQSGVDGKAGSFALDVGSLANTTWLDSALNLNTKTNTGGFTQERSIRVRTGDVTIDGLAVAKNYSLSADSGKVSVTGTIDASGDDGLVIDASLNSRTSDLNLHGGTISLSGWDSLILTPTAKLTAAGKYFDDAGKGGSVSLATRGKQTDSYSYDTSAVLDLEPGATIDLSVRAQAPASALDDVSGTLHLRAPQLDDGSDLLIKPIPAGVIKSASDVVVEGYKVYDLASSGGLIDSTVEAKVKRDGIIFATTHADAVVSRLTENLSAVEAAKFSLQPGAEIVNSATASNAVANKLVTLYKSGSSFVTVTLLKGTSITFPSGISSDDTITCGATCKVFYADGTSANFSSGAPIAPLSAATGSAVVGLAFSSTAASASGKITLTSGASPIAILVNSATAFSTSNFASSITTQTDDLVLASTWDFSNYRFGTKSEPGVLTLRAAGNLIFNFDASLSDGFDTSSSSLWLSPLMQAGSGSWTYRLVAGADLSASDVRQVKTLARLSASSGSVLIGCGSPVLPVTSSSTRTSIIPQYYQTIRTGTGNIDIFAGRDVQLLNPLATIYTAGTQVATPTTVVTPGDFDVPTTYYKSTASNPLQYSTNPYATQFSYGGGNVTISAQNDVLRLNSDGSANSSQEMPTNWLYRRGYLNPDGTFGAISTRTGIPEVASTAWWVDFSNFFQDVGTLGGGNVVITAGGKISNVDAVVPTNARMSKISASGDLLAADQTLVELGGGNLVVHAGADINGGAYYVENGVGSLSAGGSIHTDPTRTTLTASQLTGLFNAVPDQTTWLPTTLFLGKGDFHVHAVGDVLLGSTANPFLLPQGINNSFFQLTEFSTYAEDNVVDVVSLDGTVTMKGGSGDGSLSRWYNNKLLNATGTIAANTQPWLRLAETSMGTDFDVATRLFPGTLKVTAFSGNINLIQDLTLASSSVGGLKLIAGGAISGLQAGDLNNDTVAHSDANPYIWNASTIHVSDFDPSLVPRITSPDGLFTASTKTTFTTISAQSLLSNFNLLFGEDGVTSNTLAEQLLWHGRNPNDSTNLSSHALHTVDSTGPVRVYAGSGDISGLTLYSPKAARMIAGNDITDVGLYIQNVNTNDVSVVSAGRDIIAYDPNSALRLLAATPGNTLNGNTPQSGDIQMSGPGSIEVLAGRSVDLGAPLSTSSGEGIAVGIASIGNKRNPYLPFTGADVTVAAGLGGSAADSFATDDVARFITRYLDPTGGNILATTYLPELGRLMGMSSDATDAEIWAAFNDTSKYPGEQTGLSVNATGLSKRNQLALDTFYLVLRNSGRDHNNVTTSADNNYEEGMRAIATLFPGQDTNGNYQWRAIGDIALSSREIRTTNGGNISLFAPGGGLVLGYNSALKDSSKPPPGIITEHGGNIYSFSRGNVDVGVFRIFTLRGGSEIIWSTLGNIAAGVSSKTVRAAPPTSLLFDEQSADVKIDVAGLATGGGIGVLATKAGVIAGDIDLIAPTGTVDAGDAGIRASGNLNIAALHVNNTSNISVGGASTGTPPPPAAPNISGLTAASNTGASVAATATEVTKHDGGVTPPTELPSIVTVEVIGYGGEEGGDDSQRSESATRPEHTTQVEDRVAVKEQRT